MHDRMARVKTDEEKEAALLSMKICDPAAGSGHFLLAAARRIAREVASLRSGEAEPTPSDYRAAMRDVIRNCIYAVDKNPLAVDLCKVALWIEGHEPGLPLSFLDYRVKNGDSLVGVADMTVVDEGIPDGAYKVIGDDDKDCRLGTSQAQPDGERRRNSILTRQSEHVGRRTERDGATVPDSRSGAGSERTGRAREARYI